VRLDEHLVIYGGKAFRKHARDCPILPGILRCWTPLVVWAACAARNRRWLRRGKRWRRRQPGP